MPGIIVAPLRDGALTEIQSGAALGDGDLSFDTRQPVMDGAYPHRLRVGIQTPQRKRFGGLEIAIAMLVMYGERLGRLAHDARRTAGRGDETPPAGRRVRMLPR